MAIANKEEVKAEIPLEKMPLSSLGEYMKYNARARKMNKEAKRLDRNLKEGIYPIIPCPEDLHPKQKVVFTRKDQPKNVLPVYFSNDMIDYKKTLTPGKTYDIPVCVLEYLSEKGTAVWGLVENEDGSKDTKITSKDTRFSLRTIYR